MSRLTLTGRGRRRLEGGHPWIYRDDLAEIDAEPGALAPVLAPSGAVLGWGVVSSASKIAVRMVTRSAEPPGRELWARAVRRAVAARARMGLLDPAGACRLIGGDADGVPGFVLDRYRDVGVVQSGCQASDRMRDFLVGLVDEALAAEGGGAVRLAHVLDRSDAGVRRLEALEPRVEWVRGGVEGVVEVEERVPGAPRLVYEVDVLAGHKTGHYLDQRENRVRAAARAPRGARVLDAFSYDGLFGIRAALAGAAEVVALDQSAAAGERLARNAERNGVADRVRFERGNAMVDLRRRAAEGERFDVVVVDPPAFARNKREAEGAARGYRELNLRALQIVREGGYLVTCSCSYNVKSEAFLGYLAEAARDAGVMAWLVETTGASPDHPVLLGLPESAYLKCAVVRR